MILLTPEQFKKVVAYGCDRWGKNSLAAAEMLLVEGKTPIEVAQKLGISRGMVSNVKRLFLDKHKKLAAAMFMAKEKPAALAHRLDLYLDSINELLNSGYAIGQVVHFLNQNGVEITNEDLNEFLEFLRSKGQ